MKSFYLATIFGTIAGISASVASASVAWGITVQFTVAAICYCLGQIEDAILEKEQ